MSKSLDDFESSQTNLAISRTGIFVDDRPNLSIPCKSGTFDAEFDLLESTLSELKDGEHESTCIRPNKLILENNSKINKPSNTSNSTINSNSRLDSEFLGNDNRFVSEVPSSSQCQDTCNNMPECELTHSLSETQQSKPLCCQGDTVISHSEVAFSHSDPNFCETRSEITNVCSIEANNKPVLLVSFDQNINTSDNVECDRQTSLSLKLINRDPKCSDILSLVGEEPSESTKNSDRGCDFYTLGNKSPINVADKLEETYLKPVLNKPKTLRTSVNSCEYSSETAAVMGDADIANGDPPCCPDGSNNELGIVANLKVNDSEVDSEVPQLEGRQENITEVMKEEQQENLESDKTTPTKLISEPGRRVETQVCNENLDDEPVKKQGFFFSTPTVSRGLQGDSNDKNSDAPDFGLVSPLDVKPLKGKQNLKRKYISLQPIEEIDEDNDTLTEKKVKVDEVMDTVADSGAPSEAGPSSSFKQFEAPARSLLKKWQPSCLSRNVSANSFIVLDECGETEFEDCSKLGQENYLSRLDDFEIACQSLTEELMKSSSNIETLEKYHSQVQLENQMDDEKFDEILKELTMNVDLDDKTCLSVRSMDESTISNLDTTVHIARAMKESVDILLSDTEKRGDLDNKSSLFDKNNKTVIEENHIPASEEPRTADKMIDSVKIEPISETQKSSHDNSGPEIKSTEDKPTSDEEILEVDEEDFLLDENDNGKDKPYEFFEFVSTDPKENEDNYNPDWQKLGRLTSDEERYKAVRDRWRSLVPPDPNRNLTHRQWRARNQKPPITLSPLNNNHQLMDDNEKNQLCTAVFENKISKIVQDLEDSRMNIYRERNREFENLGIMQDEEQRRASMSGYSYRDMLIMHSQHLNQCKAVKVRYDQELKRIQDVTEEKIRILNEASKEVLNFQNFYKGVGARDDNKKMYMTELMVQELMETEEMLEQYKVYYN